MLSVDVFYVVRDRRIWRYSRFYEQCICTLYVVRDSRIFGCSRVYVQCRCIVYVVRVSRIFRCSRVYVQCSCIAPRWYLHLVVVEGLVSSSNPESYAGCSFATNRVSQVGNIKRVGTKRREIPRRW